MGVPGGERGGPRWPVYPCALAAGLAVGGCASSASPSVASCFARHAAAGQAGSAPGARANPAVAAAWTLPGGNLQNTRDVASPITSSNVTKLGVAWCVPVESTGLASPGRRTGRRIRDDAGGRARRGVHARTWSRT